MANSNFIVQNGLTVGPLTIDAATGSITTSGDVNITGNLGVSQISKNDSSVSINDTGTGSTIVMKIDGSTEQTIDANGINLASGDAYSINGTSVLSSTTLGSGVTASSLTSVGTLTSLAVGAVTSSGTIIASTVNAGTIGNIGATLTGTLSTASQPSVTTLAGVTSVGTSGATTTAVGNFTVVGNLTIQGTTSQVGTQNLTIQDSIIDLHTFANLAPLTTDDGRDVGIKFHYYKAAQGGDNVAFLGWANDTGALEYYATGSEVGNVFTGTAYGVIKSGEMTLANTTASTNTTTGALRVAGGAGIVGALNVGANVTVTGSVLASANVTYNLGSSTTWWNNIYGTSTHALYADLAENYQGDKFYNPGTVVMFGGSAEVTLAEADTTRVAGVVSTNPATLMNGALSGPNVVALALTGRVPCMVIGPIKKGDLMVSAGFGYAKVNNAPSVGTIIGKALEDFPINGKGVIEVVVGRF